MLIAPIALLLALSDVPAAAADPSTTVVTTATAETDVVSDAPAPASDAAAAAVPAQDEAKKKDEGLRFVWKEHPSLRNDKWLRLDFTSKIQFDKMNPGDDPQDFDDLVLQRARVGIDGELWSFLQFSIERELSSSSAENKVNAKSTKTPWRDAYVDLNFADGFQIRAGRFKIPFSLDQLTGIGNLDFASRSLGGIYLAPARDNGVEAHGRFFKRALNYSAGVFAHDGDNARSSKLVGGDLTFAARVSGTPLKAVKALNLDKAEFGGNFTSSEVSDESELPNGLRGRTVMSQYTFFESVFVKGTRRRYGADFEWTNHQFGARAEYIYVSDQREGQGLRGDTLNPARARAYHVEGTWLVTGDKKERPLEPKRPVYRKGIGAVELAARYERLWFDSEPTGEPAFSNSRAEVILPNGDTVLTLGVNWFLTRWTKLMLNGIHEELQDPGRTPLPDGGTAFWSTLLRLQLSL